MADAPKTRTRRAAARAAAPRAASPRPSRARAPKQAAVASSAAAPGGAAAVKSVNLALQGGGAHGAFAWGVLDRLLEDERLSFEAVSATSAGAMNATVMAYGLTVGGRQGAKDALAGFWKRISEAGSRSVLQPSWADRLSGSRSLEMSPAFVVFDMMTRLLSPYQFNPFNLNPLRDVLEASVDFEALRRACALRLFLAATNVRSGKVRVFTEGEVTADAVLASGCLPFLFHTVEIDGEAYWDGGYMGNPAIFPLIYGSKTNDVVIVHINPLWRDEVPRTAQEIMNRVNEISFNSSLMREMRAIAFVTKLIDTGQLDDTHRRMLIHSISNDEAMRSYGVTSKLNPDWGFLCELKEIGRATADRWLDATFERIGRESTVDIASHYL
jgi:NTE family protein